MTDLEALKIAFNDLTLRVIKLESSRAVPPPPQSSSSSVDINDKFGNPSIRKDPPRWTGASYVGKNYADCPADYLEILAGFLEWKAGKNDEEPERAKYASYDRKDAARARAWAERFRTSPKKDAYGPGLDMDYSKDGDEIPF